MKVAMLLSAIMATTVITMPIYAQADIAVQAAILQQQITNYAIMVEELNAMKQNIENTYKTYQSVSASLEQLGQGDYWDTMMRLDQAARLYTDSKSMIKNTNFSIGTRQVALLELGKAPGVLKEENQRLRDKDYTDREKANAFNFFGYSHAMQELATDIDAVLDHKANAIIAESYALDNQTEQQSGIKTTAELSQDILIKAGGTISPTELQGLSLQMLALLLNEIERLKKITLDASALEALEKNERAVRGTMVTLGIAEESTRQYGFTEEFWEYE